MIKGKRILITGFAGSVGQELVYQLSKHNKIYGLDINEIGTLDLVEEMKQEKRWVYGRVGDIRDEKTIQDVFSDFKPQIVFHTAAYKSVNMMELSPIEAIKTNIIGTYNVLSEAKKWECLERFVLISSDKAVNSNSIMGATKRCAEIIVKNQGKGFIVVRFGNVLGSRGSILPIWQRQINKGQPLTITDERMERFMMTIEESCELVIKAAEMGEGGEIFILDMKVKVNILDFAKKIIQETRQDIPIKMIGIREGETLSEELMTIEEKGRAIKKDKFWIIK